MTPIIEFLGYSPLPEATALGERLVRQRTSLGLSQQEAGKHHMNTADVARSRCDSPY